MKLIGKGSFTTAYLLEDNSVLLYSNDPIKECMSWGHFPTSRLFPEVKFSEHTFDQFGNNTYTMKYYPKVHSLKNALCERDYRLYQLLRKLPSSINVRNKCDLYSLWYKTFNTIPDEFKEEREEIIEALDACANHGTDINFEISPRNVAVDGNELVLLDCFFMSSKLQETLKRRAA